MALYLCVWYFNLFCIFWYGTRSVMCGCNEFSHQMTQILVMPLIYWFPEAGSSTCYSPNIWLSLSNPPQALWSCWGLTDTQIDAVAHPLQWALQGGTSPWNVRIAYCMILGNVRYECQWVTAKGRDSPLLMQNVTYLLNERKVLWIKLWDLWGEAVTGFTNQLAARDKWGPSLL